MTVETSRTDIALWTVLRAIAALAVVVFHFKAHVVLPVAALGVFGPVIENGDRGVDLFFILSGMVMHHVYGDARRDRNFDYRNFLVRRLARIYPVHIVTLIAFTVLLSAASLSHVASVDIALLVQDFPIQLLLLHGLGFGGSETLNYPSWSISSEMLIYLLFPAIAWLQRPSHLPPMLSLTIALIMLWIVDDATNFAGNGAVRAGVDFFLGVGVCRLLPARRLPRLGGSAILIGVLLFGLAVNRGWPASMTVCALALVLAGAFCADPREASPAMRPLVYLGKISYSIYMVHALVEAAGFALARMLLGTPHDQSPVWVMILLVGVTVGIAALVYHFVERPSRAYIIGRWQQRRAANIVRTA